MTEEKLKNIFRPVAVLEGISLILLFFFAMPMKYMYDEPIYVKYIGWAHGLLFMAFMALLAMALIWYKWGIKTGVIFFLGALIPFGAFYVDRKYLK